MVSQYSHNTFFLVRHGEARNNVLNIVSSSEREHEYHLTELGRDQIGQTAAFLRERDPHFIVASPLLRTRESAEIIREAFDVPVTFDRRLVEVRFGTFEEGDVNSFLEFMREHGGRLVGFPEHGIEGWKDVRERVRSFLSDVSASFTGKRIVIVSHGDTLQEMYGELVGVPVGDSQKPGHAWFPHKGSCMLISETHIEEFIPKKPNLGKRDVY